MSQITQLLAQVEMDINNFEKIEVEYHTDLSKNIFNKIHHLPWAMRLSSAGALHPDSRYDIVVSKPRATLLTFAEKSELSVDGQVHHTTEDPFAILNQLEAHLPDLRVLESELPFCGGLLGLFGYDLGKRVEKLPRIAKQDFVQPDLAIGLYDWALVVDHNAQQAFAIGIDAKRQFDELVANCAFGSAPFRLDSAWQANMTRAQYIEKFNRVKEYIYAGDCYQINLAQRFSAPYQGCEWQAYCALEEANKGPFSAFIRLPETVILSVSPERFISLDNGHMQTKPIKGTRVKLNDPALDAQQIKSLRSAEKDQAENLMIVDLLRNDFGRVAAPGSVNVPKLFDVETFPAVHHLVSTVEATLSQGNSASDLLKACFPGGSITGAPKIRAMEIIEELEPDARTTYCGSIGYISANKKMDTSITIRTLVAQQGKIYAWAGGGLVADSEAEAEYQETLDKLSRILPVLLAM